ncbi:sensor histidine kinase [Bacillus niameyensis]|uniref:sensor histidine kinase n=1 Tax=Bacillus niameyensis TaxID=1522308 RepID=UPI00078680E6|nr:HAMP domain-containing sensor histidine kinase [Bacillus niameyensis]
MIKNKIFRKEQLKFMILNLIAFTLIFTIFDIIIFHQVQRTLFSKSDHELLAFKDMLIEQPFDKNRTPPPLDGRQRPNPNPRITVLKWNKAGEIMNEKEIGSLLYESYFQDYQLDEAPLDVITTTTIDDVYHFRYLLFQDPNNEEGAYTQVLISIDAEYTFVDNFEKLLLICSIIFILLSITASYLLSKRMMTPIIRSWNKQAEFVENASHELRTPLTIIQNKLELLLTTPAEKIMDKFEHIALSLSETRRLSKLTSDLLTLARADSAETELIKSSIPIDSFIKNICTPYIEIAESQDKQFWLNLNCHEQLEADEDRLHQLFVILLDNALKYTAEGDSIGVKTYNEDAKIYIEISDTGIGIKPENEKHIFDRFYREDKARSRETGGSGLGLSIAQWIVAKHGGTIAVIRGQQKGTTFQVKLPK